LGEPSETCKTRQRTTTTCEPARPCPSLSPSPSTLFQVPRTTTHEAQADGTGSLPSMEPARQPPLPSPPPLVGGDWPARPVVMWGRRHGRLPTDKWLDTGGCQGRASALSVESVAGGPLAQVPTGAPRERPWAETDMPVQQAGADWRSAARLAQRDCTRRNEAHFSRSS